MESVWEQRTRESDGSYEAGVALLRPSIHDKGDDPLATFAIFGMDSDKLIPSECAQETRIEQ